MTEDFSIIDRQEWMSVLSKANWQDLKPLWESRFDDKDFDVLRTPETGLVMIRARMGGTGRAFNAGEATVTRCSVTNSVGTKGHAYVLGRNGEHALAAAQIDCALQLEDNKNELLKEIVLPLKRRQQDRLQKNRRKAAATKVDFFTLARGEDE